MFAESLLGGQKRKRVMVLIYSYYMNYSYTHIILEISIICVRVRDTEIFFLINYRMKENFPSPLILSCLYFIYCYFDFEIIFVLNHCTNSPLMKSVSFVCVIIFFLFFNQLYNERKFSIWFNIVYARNYI